MINLFSAAVAATFSGERPHNFCISVLVFVFLKLLFIYTVKYSREPVVQCPRLESHSIINFLSVHFTSCSISSMHKPFVQGNRQSNVKPPDDCPTWQFDMMLNTTPTRPVKCSHTLTCWLSILGVLSDAQ